jgi:hypothetical protein
MIIAIALALLASMPPTIPLVQDAKPDFSGRWVVDRKVSSEAPYLDLVIEHKEPSLVWTLRSNFDDGCSHRTPVMTSRSRWDGRALVIVSAVEGTTESATSKWELSADRKTLTVSSKGTGPKGPTSAKVVYNQYNGEHEPECGDLLREPVAVYIFTKTDPSRPGDIAQQERLDFVRNVKTALQDMKTLRAVESPDDARITIEVFGRRPTSDLSTASIALDTATEEYGVRVQLTAGDSVTTIVHMHNQPFISAWPVLARMTAFRIGVWVTKNRAKLE